MTNALGPIIGTAAAFGGAVLDERKRKELLSGARDDLRGAERDYASGMANLASQQYKVGQRERDLATIMAGTSPDFSGAKSDLATTLDMINDPRAQAASIPGLMGQTQQAREAELERSRAGDIASTQFLAGAEKAARDANLGLRRQEGMMDTQFAQQNLMTAGQNVSQLEAQNPFADALATSAQLWAGYTPSASKGGKTDLITQNGTGGAGDNFAKYGGKMDVISRILNEGGKPVVQKLYGPEDHDKKKFAIMESGAVLDEDNGEKVAEATGQEYILNSEQAEGIHDNYDIIKAKMDAGEEISQEEWMIFYKAVDEVFSQPQFNEERA
jgi:hypothetical protein